jgi:type II secretory pathway component PulL
MGREWLSSDMEVGMNTQAPTRVELSAAQALVDWKNQFANLVRSGAGEAAALEGSPEITLLHYHRAAEQAIEELGQQLKAKATINERRKAA